MSVVADTKVAVRSGGDRSVEDAGELDALVRVVPRGYVQRPVRVRKVRLVRAGDQRRPGHRVSAPRRGYPVACAPRSRPLSLGWFVLAAGLVMLMVFGVGWLASGSGPSAAPVPTATTIVSIHSGETLWDVATSEAPSAAPQAVVDRIRQLNDLTDAVLYPGERLTVPVDATR